MRLNRGKIPPMRGWTCEGSIRVRAACAQRAGQCIYLIRDAALAYSTQTVLCHVWTAPLVKSFLGHVNISGAVMSSACLCGEDPLALMLRPRELFAPITVSRSIGR